MTAVGEERTELPVSSTTKSSLTKSIELSAHQMNNGRCPDCQGHMVSDLV